MKNKIEYLTKPGRIGSLEIRNRMIMAPMGTSYGTPTGEVTQRLIDYLEARAKGGVGLIIVENTLVRPHEEYGESFVCQLTMWDYNSIPQWHELTSAIHFWGARVFVQINYPGSNVIPVGAPGVQPVTPSPMVIDSRSGEPIMSREASIKEIERLVEQYGETAFVAKLAGFDGVNIHCVHGYGIAGFQSGYMNRRADQYGGSLDNRMRFGLEILKKDKEKVGNDFPVTCRIPAEEFVPGGIHPDESVKIAQKYVEGGAHAIDLSCGTSVRGNKIVQSRYLPRVFLEPYFEMFKKAVSVPLIVAGSFNDPRDGERVLAEGKADFIAIGRGLLADAEYPNKAAEGRLEDIRPCRRCIDGCIHSHQEFFLPTDCAVNVEVGMEAKYKIVPAKKPKKVLVVGGGPAGMEAARVARLRGHDVILFEKSDQLGGNMIPGSVPNFKEEERWLIEWFSTQLKKLGVRVELNQEVRAEKVSDRYDAAIVATGAVPIVPEIPGVEKAVTATDVLLGKASAGKEVIVVGGGSVGCETALYLAEQGKKVKILEMLDDIALDIDKRIVKPSLIERMTNSGVTWFTGMRAVEVLDQGVNCISGGNKSTFPADTVVLAVGLKPVNALLNGLKEKIPECYAIGDCAGPRKVFQAIHEGSLIARRI